MERITYEIATTDRPLATLGIDPSSELGATLTGCRLRLIWIEKGWNVPVKVTLTVQPCKLGPKGRREACWGAQLLMRHASKIQPSEGLSLRSAILDEIETSVTSRRRQVAA